MTRNFVFGFSILAVVSGVYGCSPGRNSQSPELAPQGSTSEMSLFFAPHSGLVGDPDLFSAAISYENQNEDILRRGSLPKLGEWLKLRDLPAGINAKLKMDLYKHKFSPELKTHECIGSEILQLTPGKPAQTEIICAPTVGDSAPVTVFVKTAALDVMIKEADSSAILAAIDWKQDRAFAQVDSEKQKISLRQELGQLLIRVGGAAEFSVASPANETTPVERLILGEELILTPTGGRVFSSLTQATLKLSAKPFAIRVNDEWKTVLPIIIQAQNDVIGVSGNIIEEDLWRDFTVASYNVENLFDQTDHDVNRGYGDYRLIVNENGMASNYGEPVDFKGQKTSFTAVKIDHIRQVLQAISPRGPEIVGLSEIENEAVLGQLFEAVKDLGYVAHRFAHEEGKTPLTAVGVGLISKYPIIKSEFIVPATPADSQEALRAILKVTVDVKGHPLVVYVNHWKSKGGPESLRIRCAEALEADIQSMLMLDPNADYMILGDLNSDYNENISMTAVQNDSLGRTGINDVLKSQGDELKAAKGDEGAKFNMWYELRREERGSAWYPQHGWGTLDHIIVGKGIFESQGISYVDNSFRLPNANLPQFKFLFNQDGTPKRWEGKREGKFTRHGIEGYSDHLPLFARFQIKKNQNEGRIRLFRPSTPD